MLIASLSLALITLFAAVAVWGILLTIRQRGGLRMTGIALAIQGVLLLLIMIVLTSIPIIGLEPTVPVDLVPTLLQAGLTLLAIVGVGGLVFLLARRFVRRAQEPRARLRAGALLVSLPIVGILGMGGLWQLSTPERVRERDPFKRLIEVPEGFTSTVYVNEKLDNPTTITFAPDGALYVGDIGGNIWVARDSDNNGSAEQIERFAEGFTFLTGLIVHEGEVYVASQGKIEALKDDNGDGVYDQRRTLVDGLPSMVYIPHTNNALSLGPDGRLYFGVGSTTNGEVEQNEFAAGIFTVKLDGSDLKPYARGLSNSFDVAFNAAGDMFAADNQPGAAGSVSDELNYIVEGGHYGYPYFFGDPPKEGSTRGPVATFPPHSSPNGLTFYSATQFPQAYTDNMFIALWSTGEVHRVELAKSAGGEYLSRTSPFAKGFVYPLDVTVGPDGSLYVADFGTSAVYRISYN
jgi:putative membrane-bound dehydrogenase-like protein